MTLPSPRILFAIAALVFTFGAPVRADEIDDAFDSIEKKIEELAKDPKKEAVAEVFGKQVTTLKSYYQQQDYERTRSFLNSLTDFRAASGNPEIQKEWSKLSELLIPKMKQWEEEQAEANRQAIAALVEDTRKACQEAKTSADLDALLVLCAAVQLYRPRSGDPLAERTARRLQGVVSTLNRMGDYLDWKAAGNAKRANDVLRSLRSGDSGLPVLTMEEIDSRFIPEQPEAQGSQVLIVKVFQGVESPADIDKVLTRLAELEANPAYVDKGWMQSTRRAAEFLQQAWKAVESGDHQGASKSLSRVSSSYGADTYLEPLKFQIERRILTAKTKNLTTLEWQPDEDYSTYASRVLEEMHSKGNYEGMIELMKIPNSTVKTGSGETYTRDRVAIEQYLAGKRLENVGDDLGAVASYRAVVGMPSPGKYAPIKEAEEAMKRLKEKNPEVFTNYDLMLAEDIRLLRQQIQSIVRIPPGHRPNYP